MTKTIQILFLIFLASQTASAFLCSECSAGCCNSSRKCKTASTSCFFYSGNTVSQEEATSCQNNNDCLSGCCVQNTCTFKDRCLSGPTPIATTPQCSQCALGCCTKLRLCALNLNDCMIYDGDVSSQQSLDPPATVTCDANSCSSGCCIGDKCASSADQCPENTAVVFFSAFVSVIIFIIFVLVNLYWFYCSLQKQKLSNDIQAELKRIRYKHPRKYQLLVPTVMPAEDALNNRTNLFKV